MTKKYLSQSARFRRTAVHWRRSSLPLQYLSFAQQSRNRHFIGVMGYVSSAAMTKTPRTIWFVLSPGTDEHTRPGTLNIPRTPSFSPSFLDFPFALQNTNELYKHHMYEYNVSHLRLANLPHLLRRRLQTCEQKKKS